MYLSDINRLEKYLAKFKYYVRDGYEPTPEERTAIQNIQNQVEQIEETLFNLRVAKGSVSGLIMKSLKEAKPPEFESVFMTANEKGFSISLPIYNLLTNNNPDQYQNYNHNENIRNWATNLVRSSQRHFARQETPESEIKVVLDLNHIHPKLKMFNLRFTGSLEFNFELTKRIAQNDADRGMICGEIMNTLQRFIISQRTSMNLPELVLNPPQE